MIAMMEGESNPIKKFRDEDGSAFLVFPSYPSADSDVPPHPLGKCVIMTDSIDFLHPYTVLTNTSALVPYREVGHAW